MVVNLHPGFRPWLSGHEVPPALNEAVVSQRVRVFWLQMPVNEATHHALRADAGALPMSITPLNASDEMHAGRIVHRRTVQRRDAIPSGHRASVHNGTVIAIEEASWTRLWDELEPAPRW